MGALGMRRLEAPLLARACRCEQPLTYLEPGEGACCAKCGHRLGKAFVPASTATGTPLGGSAPSAPATRDESEELAFPASPPVDAGPDFEWPFASVPAGPHQPEHERGTF
jgi:hypothetical protein